MATVRKVLGQQDSTALGAGVYGLLYKAPAATDTVVSSIVVCNRTGGALTFQLECRVADAATAVKQDLANGVTVAANSVVTLTLGITLATTDALYFSGSAAGLSCNAFGQENT